MASDRMYSAWVCGYVCNSCHRPINVQEGRIAAGLRQHSCGTKSPKVVGQEWEKLAKALAFQKGMIDHEVGTVLGAAEKYLLPEMQSPLYCWKCENCGYLSKRKHDIERHVQNKIEECCTWTKCEARMTRYGRLVPKTFISSGISAAPSVFQKAVLQTSISLSATGYPMQQHNTPYGTFESAYLLPHQELKLPLSFHDISKVDDFDNEGKSKLVSLTEHLEQYKYGEFDVCTI